MVGDWNGAGGLVSWKGLGPGSWCGHFKREKGEGHSGDRPCSTVCSSVFLAQSLRPLCPCMLPLSLQSSRPGMPL